VTLRAFERLLTGVCAFVILQHVLVPKAAGADFAGEALVPRWILGDSTARGISTRSLVRGIGGTAAGGWGNRTSWCVV